MTLNLGIQYALAAVISCSMLGLSLVAPVTAEDDTDKVKIVINVLGSANAEVQERMLELQEAGIDIPLVAKAYYSQAVAEYHDAQQALNFGDADLAKIRAMKAMEQFKKTTDQLGTLGENQDETVGIVDVDERIAILQNKADYLKTLAKSNHDTLDFSAFNSAVKLATNALRDGSIEEAKKQLALAESVLADIKGDIQDAADVKKDTRAKDFAQKVVTRLSDMVAKADKHDKVANSSSVLQFTMFIEKLKNATDVDEIMNMTDDLSALESMIREYKVGSHSSTADESNDGTGAGREDKTDSRDNEERDDADDRPKDEDKHNDDDRPKDEDKHKDDDRPKDEDKHKEANQ